MEDDDFTFPTVAAAPPPEGQLGHDDDDDYPVHLLQLPLPEFAAASPLWPFAGSPKTTASSPPVTADEEALVSGSSGLAEHRAEADDEERVAAEEERMDLLWGGTTTATAPAPASRSSGHEEPSKHRTEAEDEERAAAVAEAERMDLLWESFNEELLLRRAPSKAAAADHPGRATRPGLDPADWYLCNYPPSDAESEETSASSPRRSGYGCAPTMLRASSRAGGVGQFCSSPRSRRRSRGAAAGWALLLRLFRRLFAVDKTVSRSHGGIYVP